MPVSPNLYLICWLSSSPEIQFTPGWFSTEKHKQTGTKCYLLETSAHWGCVAGVKLSAHNPARHERSQVASGSQAFGTGLPNSIMLNTWHPALGLSWLLISAINLLPSRTGCSGKKLLYLCPLIASHSQKTILCSWHSRVPACWLSINKIMPGKSPSGSGERVEERCCRVLRYSGHEVMLNGKRNMPLLNNN